MSVQFGDEAGNHILAISTDLMLSSFGGRPEWELFIRLSDLAIRRYCNCAIYQMELMGIIRAFVSPERASQHFQLSFRERQLLVYPADWRQDILFDRIRRPFYLACGIGGSSGTSAEKIF